MTERWPANDRRIHCRPPAIDRSPDGHQWASGRSSAGHRWRRWGIGQKFGHFPRKSNGGLTVSQRWPSGARWLTLQHGSRSRKSADELPISKNRHQRKIRQSPLDLWSIVTSALLKICLTKAKIKHNALFTKVKKKVIGILRVHHKPHNHKTCFQTTVTYKNARTILDLW